MGAALGIPKMPEIGPSPEALLKIGEVVEDFVVGFLLVYEKEWNEAYKADPEKKDHKKINETARKVADKKGELDKKIDEMVENSGPIKDELKKQLDDGLGSNASNVPQGMKDKAVDKALAAAYGKVIDVALEKASQKLLQRKNGGGGADETDVETGGAGVGRGVGSDASGGVGGVARAAAIEPEDASVPKLTDTEALMKKIQYVDAAVDVILRIHPECGFVAADLKEQVMRQTLQDFPGWNAGMSNPVPVQKHALNLIRLLKPLHSPEKEVLLQGRLIERAFHAFPNAKNKEVAQHVSNIMDVLVEEGVVPNRDDQNALTIKVLTCTFSYKPFAINYLVRFLKASVFAITLKNYPALTARA